MRGILVQQKVSKALDGKYPESYTAEQKTETDELAYTSFILHLSDSVLRKVGKLDSTKELWEKLKKLFVKKSTPNKLFLLESFFSFKIDSSRDLDDNLDIFNKMVQDITNCGEKITEEYKAIILLNAIPDAYKEVKNAIKYGRDTLTPEIVIDSLRSKDMKLKSEKRYGEVHLMRGRSQIRGHEGGGKKKGRSRSKSKTKGKGKGKCFGCGKTGHYIKDCYAEKNKQKEKLKDQEEANSITSFNPSEVYMLIDSNIAEINATFGAHGQEWILDSGASFHVTSQRHWFDNMHESVGGHAIVCSNIAYKVVGIGDITLKLESGYVLKLRDVTFIPEMARNLISVGELEKNGFTGKIENEMIKMFKGAMMVCKGVRRNGIYALTAEVMSSSCSHLDSINSDVTQKWHNRLAHVSIKRLKFLNNKGVFGKDCVSDIPFCDHCVLGKHHRLSFSSNVHRASRVLEYIHSDLWGPATNPTFGGNRYFLSMIDDFSRRVWVFLLKDKTETFKSFKTWKTQIENQTGKTIKYLRTDNGLEFCNKDFNDLCKECGITRHKTVPYTPQQNGVAERMNRTLLDKVRCMMISSNIPKSFWGEAVMIVCYLINLTPSTTLNGDTPYEKWYGKCADYSTLRTFGCAAYSHQNEGKLEPRSRKCVFLGYPEGVKGYRLCDRSQKGVKIIVSRNVTFNETEMPCLKSNSTNQQDNEGEDSLEESRNISTNIPTTSCEVEIQNQAEENVENEIVEEQPL